MSSTFSQINIIVRDVDASVEFYRLVGLPIEAEAGDQHVSLELENGILLEIDSVDFVREWDSGWTGSTGGGTIFGFQVESREEVDDLFLELTSAGYHGRQAPYDAFWGARYAIVADPDGNGVGLMSPVDADLKFWPPSFTHQPAAG